MKVLYVSKALVVEAYRAKLPALGRHVEVRGVVPDRWTPGRFEPLRNGDHAHLERWPVLLPGHNHLHLYRRPAGLFSGSPPDLVHVDEEPYSAVTFQLLRLARRRGVPVVFFAWQNLAKRLPPPWGALRRHVLDRAAGAIAGSETAGEVLRGQGWTGPLVVIPQFGTDPRRFAPDPSARREIRRALGMSGSDFLVGFGGRLAAEKGIDVLLQAVAALPDPAHLLLVGAGPERSAVERAARTGGLRERVHLVGHRPSGEMPRWLAACDVLVLPSVGRAGWVEQFGRILIEAMACGVPVVGARSGEIPRVIGSDGVLVPSGDVEALAGALESLAAAPDRRAELAERGRARVLACFTHERIAERTVDFYRTVVDGRRTGEGK